MGLIKGDQSTFLTLLQLTPTVNQVAVDTPLKTPLINIAWMLLESSFGSPLYFS